MGVNLYQEIVNGDSRRVQRDGVITLPKEWREQHGVAKGDTLALRETEDGSLEVIPPE